MGSSIRQSNLFASGDWQAIYKSFRDVDFRAYDFDSIRDALIDYIRINFPESFNDYIESSEFIAIIELLSYLGTSLAFRVDLNSRENFLDTAERRESVIRLARMLSYTPRRNVAASGLFKLSGVRTNEIITDSVGRELQGTTVFWDDPNNPDSFEQFITVLNAAFTSTNPFGRPFKSGTVGTIPTDLYQFNSTSGTQITYNVSASIKGETFPIDIVNADFTDGEFFFERAPNPENSFHLIYRNDGNGLGSANTGFFLLFKQGVLESVDTVFQTPLPNRTFDIDIANINETDVFLQEINQDGSVVSQWTKVPSLIGNNTIFNSIVANDRNIYSVIPRTSDQITLKFADGNFGNTPTGIYRTWVRTSANRNVIFRPEDIENFQIAIPYLGKDGQRYQLQMIFSLEQTIGNAARAETLDQIKQRAPQVYYSQNRMVNGQDYNVFPLTRGNDIVKIKAVNRTHAGHSRYIDQNDPTGFNNNTLVFGEDGALYADNEPALFEVSGNITSQNIVSVNINEIIKNQFLENFYYSDYYDIFVSENPGDLQLDQSSNVWWTQPSSTQGISGFINGNIKPVTSPVDIAALTVPIRVGSKLKFVNIADTSEYRWVTIKSLANDSGTPVDPESVTEFGPIEISNQVRDGWGVSEYIPAFRRTLSASEIDDIVDEVDLNNDFALSYDASANAWSIVGGTPTINDTYTSTSDWLLYAQYDPTDNVWKFTTRGKRFIFESEDQARFYTDTNFSIVDVQRGQALRDVIQLLPINTKTNPPDSLGVLDDDVFMNIQSLLMYEDGYRDPRKVLVKSLDSDSDGVPDTPLLLNQVINNFDESPQNVFFERFTDFDGYEYFKLWKSNQVTISDITTADLIKFQGSVWVVGDISAATIDLLITDSTISEVVDAINNSVVTDGTARFARSQTFDGLVVYNGTFYAINQSADGLSVESSIDYDHVVKVGRSATQNLLDAEQNPLYFKWNHYAPRSNRIDPSISNVIDMYLITLSYFRDLIRWKDRGLPIEDLPNAPTTEDLRTQFSELNQFKMIGDQIIFKPGVFKLMFGPGAEPELRARFKVVKLPSTTIPDSEIKSRVIEAIDDYFDLSNWDFGESFYYTEMSAFIHQRLANVISTVVLVPQKADSAFGNLFQIKGEANEIFFNTATVADVDVVRNLTETNLRIR